MAKTEKRTNWFAFLLYNILKSPSPKMLTIPLSSKQFSNCDKPPNDIRHQKPQSSSPNTTKTDPIFTPEKKPTIHHLKFIIQNYLQ